MVKIEDLDQEFAKSRRVISFRRIGVLLFVCAIGCYWISQKMGHSLTEEVEEDSDAMTKRVQEIEKARKDEEDFQRDFRRSLSQNDSTELTMGAHRYKLFKKPRLNFKLAIKYCKRMDGKLALTHKAENTRKLQQLVGERDRKVEMEEYYGRSRNAVWVGRDKPKKKKKKKEEDANNEANYMDYMGGGGMMGGGGRGGEEMCPGISPNSIYVPAPCHSSLPFICEFDKNSARKPLPNGKEFRGRGRGGRYEPEMDDMGGEPMHDEL